MKTFFIKAFKILLEGIKHHWVSLLCMVYFFVASFVVCYRHPELVSYLEVFYSLPSDFIAFLVFFLFSIVSGFIFCFSMLLHVADVIVDHFKKSK